MERQVPSPETQREQDEEFRGPKPTLAQMRKTLFISKTAGVKQEWKVSEEKVVLPSGREAPTLPTRVLGLCVHAGSVVSGSVVPWTVARQAPLSGKFSRQE